MFLINKIFAIRNSDNPDEEKPFLEHLEDLRGTIVKVIITLVIGFLISFFFRNQLMELMRAPIDGVWHIQLDKSLHDLPEEVDAETWEKATKASREGLSLSDEQRVYFYDTISGGDETMGFHIQSVNLWRSAMTIEKRKDRDLYINGLPEISPKMKEQLLGMSKYYESSNKVGPNPDAEFRRRTVFMQSLHPTEGFLLSFKLALYAGIALTFPFLLYFILQFILPGLKENEQKALFPALAIGFGLFLTGVVFSYSMVLPRVLTFFTSYSGEMGIANDWRIGEYISFTTQFILIFGLAFELPVVIMTLVFIGVLDHGIMAKNRSYAIIGILITAALITPTPDALTLCLLAVPMYLLYEISIWLAYFINRKKRKQEEEEQREEEERLRARKANSPAVVAPVGLTQHDEIDDDHIAGEEMNPDHDDLGNKITNDDEDDWAESFDCDGGENREWDEDEDLEGNGEALDPEAEDREAGNPDDNSEEK